MHNFLKSITVATILLGLIGCVQQSQNSHEKIEDVSAVVPAVEAVQAEVGRLPNEERLTGVVRAANQVEIYPEISAPVEQVYVQNGDFVQKGDLLVKLKEQQLRDLYRQAKAGADVSKARSRQAKAAYDQAESQYNRTKQLADKGLSSELDLETQAANLASAKANLELALAQVEQSQALIEQRLRELEQTEIKAPVSGLIGLRNAEIGMQVNSNMRLFVLGDPSKTIVEVSLTEAMLDYIQTGQEVRILSDRSDDFFLSANISRVSPFLDPVSHSTTAEIEVINSAQLLMPGMFVQVDVLYGDSDQATIVPVSAIFKHPITGEQGVYVAKSIGTEVQPVKQVDTSEPPAYTGPVDVSFVPVDILAKGRMRAGISNLNPGDWIITIGQDRLVGGATKAKVRTVGWERVIALQELQQEDVLREFIEGQQELIKKSQQKQEQKKDISAGNMQSAAIGR